MAASYIRIAIGVLIGVALLAFAIGYGIGAWGKQGKSGIWIALIVSILLMGAILLGSRALPVSGPLILRQIAALAIEIGCALMGGTLVATASKQNNIRFIRTSLVATGLLTALFIMVQIANVQPVLDMLQTAGLLKPKDDYKPETNKDCPANLQSLYNAFEQYVELNDKLPDTANWEDNGDFTSRVPQDEWLHCPAVSNRHDAHFGYALNDTLAGKKLNLNGKPLKTLPNASTTPLLYDSTNLSKNAHDAVKSLPKPGRHGGRNNILYLDGHVAAVAPK